MPLDSLLLSLAICSIFLIFAGVLAWADRITRNVRRGQPSDKPEAAPADLDRKHAA